MTLPIFLEQRLESNPPKSTRRSLQLKASKPPVASVNAALSMAHGARCTAAHDAQPSNQLMIGRGWCVLRRWLECKRGNSSQISMFAMTKALPCGQLKFGVHRSTLRTRVPGQSCGGASTTWTCRSAKCSCEVLHEVLLCEYLARSNTRGPR